MSNVAEQVKERNPVYFTVNACPQLVYEAFVAFCKRASWEVGLDRASYPVGLKKLLENSVEYEKILAEVRAAEIAEKEKAGSQPKKIATFGGN